MSIKILYEDNHIIAVVKPAGVLTQPTHKASTWQGQRDLPASATPKALQAGKSGEESLMDMVKDYLKEKYKKPGNVFLGLVHRLDKPVQGIVLFGKTSKGASRLSEQFRNHEIEKIYYAIVIGKPKENMVMLTNFLVKNEKTLKAEIRESREFAGKEAVLYYEVIKSNDKYSLLKIKLETGKFHQIRAQLSLAGFPILGDMKYGTSEWPNKNSIALCAIEISFRMAVEDKIINLKIPLPEEWEKLL